MWNIILSLCFLSFSVCVFSQTDIVQGPFNIDGEKNIYIKKEDDINFPLALYFNGSGEAHKIESYEVDGSAPHIETVFLLH